MSRRSQYIFRQMYVARNPNISPKLKEDIITDLSEKIKGIETHISKLDLAEGRGQNRPVRVLPPPVFVV
tara:strand:- start:636 stop:842 length:207 start_codon:yes stop_codon:yes gene_type:complete